MKQDIQFNIVKLNQCPPESINQAAKLCYEILVKKWSAENTLTETEDWFKQWLNDDIPLAYIALCSSEVVGMCSLQFNDGIRPDLMPWLGDLCVPIEHQNRGVGKSLIEAAKKKSKELGFKKLFLFAPDPNIPAYYIRLGWKKIDMDVFHGNPVTVMEIDL